MIFREGGGVILGQFPLHPNIKTLYEAPAQIKSQSSNECFGLLIHKSSGGLGKYFWFLVTPQRWSNPPCSHDNLLTHCNHFVIICDCELCRPRSLGWLDDCVGKSPKRRLVGGTGTYNKSGWWWWWWYISYDKVFACLSVTSLPRIVSRLGLRCVPRLLRKYWQIIVSIFFSRNLNL